MAGETVIESKEMSTKITEPILDPENSRFTVFPILYPSIWQLYEKQLALFWKAKEIDFSKDYDDYMELNENEKHFIKMILAFFAASDGIVNWNISERFLKDVQIMEARTAYIFQMMMEGIHGETYSLMLDNIVKDKEERKTLFSAIKEVESVKLMSEWAIKWIESSDSFAHRLIAFAIVEGVFFSGAFASIFWIKKYKGSGKQFMSGLVKSNEFIARDEGMHTEFACEVYSLLRNKLSYHEVSQIFVEGVTISKKFMNDALPCSLIGMNSDMMNSYIEYVADRLIVALGYTKLYNSTNPFGFMDTIGMMQKTNFFESRPTEYQSAYGINSSSEPIVISEDF
jgi:ribonucleotide reductase beta subunit family protein with ferritin-like domain